MQFQLAVSQLAVTPDRRRAERFTLGQFRLVPDPVSVLGVMEERLPGYRGQESAGGQVTAGEVIDLESESTTFAFEVTEVIAGRDWIAAKIRYGRSGQRRDIRNTMTGDLDLRQEPHHRAESFASLYMWLPPNSTVGTVVIGTEERSRLWSVLSRSLVSSFLAWTGYRLRFLTEVPGELVSEFRKNAVPTKLTFTVAGLPTGFGKLAGAVDVEEHDVKLVIGRRSLRANRLDALLEQLGERGPVGIGLSEDAKLGDMRIETMYRGRTRTVSMRTGEFLDPNTLVFPELVDRGPDGHVSLRSAILVSQGLLALPQEEGTLVAPAGR